MIGTQNTAQNNLTAAQNAENSVNSINSSYGPPLTTANGIAGSLNSLGNTFQTDYNQLVAAEQAQSNITSTIFTDINTIEGAADAAYSNLNIAGANLDNANNIFSMFSSISSFGGQASGLQSINSHAGAVEADVTMVGTAQGVVDADSANLTALTGILNTATNSLSAQQSQLTAAQNNMNTLVAARQSLNDAASGLTAQQDNLADVGASLTALQAQSAAGLEGNTYLLNNGQAVTISNSDAQALCTGNSATENGVTFGLTDLSKAKLQVSADNVTTTSKRDIKYNGRGMVESCDELSFTGTDVDILGLQQSWGGLSEVTKDLIMNKTLSATVVGNGRLQISSTENNTYDANGNLTGYTTITNPNGPNPKSQITTTMANITYDNLGRMLQYIKTTAQGSAVTTEQTLVPLAYVGNTNNIAESDVLDTVVAGSVITVNEVRTTCMIYNDLNQLVSYVKLTQNNGVITAEISPTATCSITARASLFIRIIR